MNEFSFDQTDLDYEAIKTEFGLTQEVLHSAVDNLLESLKTKRDSDFGKGISLGLDAELNDGHEGTYCISNSNVQFTLTRRVINGGIVRENIEGCYLVKEGEVLIQVDIASGSPITNCRLFLNDTLISSSTNSEDWAIQQSEAFHRNFVIENDEDPVRLDSTVKTERSPFAFAAKMLNDYSESMFDSERTNKMFEKLRRKNNVVWNSVNRLAKS